MQLLTGMGRTFMVWREVFYALCIFFNSSHALRRFKILRLSCKLSKLINLGLCYKQAHQFQKKASEDLKYALLHGSQGLRQHMLGSRGENTHWSGIQGSPTIKLIR
ncbi:uncharacterized protein LOC131857163 isoform X2 [Cryptomeria japonica]|uniref:uncharacterized protein LOC131857163 isoform X2 n=1 Tax=Cryptomeria japonica TaxID=3369 RepID=UPI0027DA1CA7|nr:uncharacterized protein LOC131857163 isoform X2 [Cryptomeria japonica]